MSPPPPAPEVRTLPNGVRVVADPAPGFETLALSIVAGGGARLESETEAGWSHLLEHMVFKGAGARSARAIVEEVEAAGGHINAATGYERTSFQVRALADGLRLGLEVVADLVQRPTLDPADLAQEVRVVAQEIAEAADTPDDLVFELAQAAAFADQPLGRPVLGVVESLETASPEALERWRRILYRPQRLVISAAGAFDPAELFELAERLFAETPGPERADPPAVFTGGRAGQARRLEQAHLVLLLPGVGAASPDYFAVRVFAEMLGGGMSSRLFQEARERLGLAYAIDAFAEAYADLGVVGVYAGCAAKDAPALAELVAAEFQKLAQGVTDQELARAKAQLKSGLFMARESLAARAEQAGAQMLIFGRLLGAREIAAAIDAVTAQSIREAAARLVGPQLSAPAVLGPARALAAADRFHRAMFG